MPASPFPAATRTAIQPRHALIAPDGHVASNLPGWKDSRCVVLISAALGARISQFLIEMGSKGEGRGQTRDRQCFIYILSGSAELALGSSTGKNLLRSGGYAYLPPGSTYHLNAAGGAQVLIFEKLYEPMDGVDQPGVFIWREQEVPGVPHQGDADITLQVLLPDRPEFDFAVNIFRYKPGARLPFVETHIMEHGLLMLAGEGICRLDERWYPLLAGDAIWMAPFCPQWFAATGKTPAAYIHCKDINRPVLPA